MTDAADLAAAAMLEEGLSGMMYDLSPDRQANERDADEAVHPFQRLQMQDPDSHDEDEDDNDVENQRESSENATRNIKNENSFGNTPVKIWHKRSQSDTATLLEQLKGTSAAELAGGAADADSPPSLRRPASKDETSSYLRQQQQQTVTFAPSASAKSPFGRRNSTSAAMDVASSDVGAVTVSSLTPLVPMPPSPGPPPIVTTGRVYRSCLSDKLTTRDIAALDFLLGIPLAAEESIVQHGWMLQQRRKLTYQATTGELDDEDEENELYGSDEDDYQNARRVELLEPPGNINNNNNNGTTAVPSNHSHHGRWWEKWIPRDAHHNLKSMSPDKRSRHDDGELELPTASGLTDIASSMHGTASTDTMTMATYMGTPGGLRGTGDQYQQHHQPTMATAAPVYAPGRRLEGDEAVLVQIPLKIETVTRQKYIARQAAIREWEIMVAHGLGGDSQTPQTKASSNTSSKAITKCPPLLDGRIFFSAAGSYPAQVFSLKRYEPKKEEAALRRQKLEARGGGGSHFVMPTRDWRGISYRALLPRKAVQARNQKAFNRFLRDSIHNRTKKIINSPARKQLRRFQSSGVTSTSMGDDDSDWDERRDPSNNGNSDKNNDSSDSESDDDSVSSSSSSEDEYIPGILDDPEMTLGRHRNVMIGDCVTGCVVASTIQFVKPALLKADLNKKFRERFDGWEPNKSQRKYIGARVVDGAYTLIDPTEGEGRDGDITDKNSLDVSEREHDSARGTPANIRMPPSLTLSKIRSVKRQALIAFAKANLDIGTVALACVYFERLCLSCQVDKTNRRLCFASCLLLASKVNEPNEVLVIKEDRKSSGGGADSGDEDDQKRKKKVTRLESSIRPSKRSSTMFASLLEFFTQDWSLSLKHLFAAEWGVFAALRFSLHATPSQVAFHFKRLMKSLEWNPALYLGTEMFEQWQDALAEEEKRKVARDKRREIRRAKRKRRLQIELEKEVIRGKQQEKEKEKMRRKSKGSAPPVELDNSTGKKKTKAPSPKLDKKDSSGSAQPEPTQQSDDSLLGPGIKRNTPNRSSSKKFLQAMSRAAAPHASSPKERPGFGSAPSSTLQLGDTSAALNDSPGTGGLPPPTPTSASSGVVNKKGRSMKLLSRFMSRPLSSDKLDTLSRSGRDTSPKRSKSPFALGLPLSGSMPMIAQEDSLRGEQILQQGGEEPSELSLALGNRSNIDIETGVVGGGLARAGNNSDDDANSVIAGSDSGIVI